ncbi:MAG: 3-dehydroquinate synthase, partial [Gammaproteobacteria bacterium]|nr:3-dehydroquinate synthase [Gammaproteobacteria bacterium]
EWLHGEAVGTGMLMAADMSQRMGWLSEHDVERVDDIIDKAGLPTRYPASMKQQKFLDLMSVDKKVEAGQMRLVLLKSLGEAVITSDFEPAVLRDTLDAHRSVEG